MKKKILVVDDHRTMLELMTDLLEEEGHEVVTVEDGFSALNKLACFVPDIMFVDLIMPKIGGDKLCQIVRKMPHLNHCYLVVISGAVAEHEVDYTERVGADACIAKGPFNIMAKHVLAVIKESESPQRATRPKRIMGLDGVYSRQVTKELLSRNRHLETVLESMAEGILELFSERIVYANSAAVSLFGLPQEKLPGSYPPDLFDEIERSKVEALLKSGDDRPYEIGQHKPVELKGRQVTVKKLPVKGEPATTIILIEDVTDRKRLEARLQQAQKMEAIGTLAGGFAHDFNNLLMGIQGNVSLMLLDIESTHPHYKRLTSIEKQVESGSELTAQLLGYARKGRYVVKPIDLNRLVEITSDTFGRTKKEITIHRELAEDLFEIRADQGQIEHVLLNLFINAADAMPGGGELILRTMNTTSEDMTGKLYDPKQGQYVLLSVTDTGIGMDEETVERIFDPFFTTKEMGRGTGLGLASAYGIIKGHGGYIDVESRKGQGTTFKIYLPASEKKVRKPVKTAEPLIKGAGTVLLADDEEVIFVKGKDLTPMRGQRGGIPDQKMVVRALPDMSAG